MKQKGKMILSTIMGQKISPDLWMKWIRENGFDQIDFYGCFPLYSPFSYKDPQMRKERLLGWTKRLRKEQLHVFSYTPEMRNFPLNLADINEEIRKETVTYCERALEDGVSLEAEYVRVNGGYRYLGLPRERVFDQLCRSMEILLNKAEKENICILIGPEDWDTTNVLDGCHQTASLFEKFQSPYLKIQLNGNLFLEGKEPAAWYRHLFGGNIKAMGVRLQAEEFDTELKMLKEADSLLERIPWIAEIEGENSMARFMASIKESICRLGNNLGGDIQE